MKQGAKVIGFIVLGLLAFWVLIKTMSERPDSCVCNDGTPIHRWATGWTRPETNCPEFCSGHGGGRPMTEDELERLQAQWRTKADAGR
jgi:hypothetical protein